MTHSLNWHKDEKKENAHRSTWHPWELTRRMSACLHWVDWDTSQTNGTFWKKMPNWTPSHWIIPLYTSCIYKRHTAVPTDRLRWNEQPRTRFEHTLPVECCMCTEALSKEVHVGHQVGANQHFLSRCISNHCIQQLFVKIWLSAVTWQHVHRHDTIYVNKRTNNHKCPKQMHLLCPSEVGGVV